MIYVTSDLHGCNPKLFQQLLDSAGFGEEDFLFVLGDVIDRGEYGAELLLWLTEQPNVQLILGNHEALMLACEFLFEEVTEESLGRLNKEQMMLLESWYENGGAPTIAGLRRLLRRTRSWYRGFWNTSGTHRFMSGWMWRRRATSWSMVDLPILIRPEIWTSMSRTSCWLSGPAWTTGILRTQR